MNVGKTALIYSIVAAVAYPSAGLAAQEPPRLRFVLGPQVDLPAKLDRTYADGRFSLTIRRAAPDSVALDALRLAERVLPTPDAIEYAAQAFLDEKDPRGPWPDRMAFMRQIKGPRWWWHEWDFTLLPFALTSSAVDHLALRLEVLAEESERYPHRQDATGSMHYTGEAVPNEDGGHTVTLSLTWQHRCGGRCGLWIEIDRVVLLDADGSVVSVKGDGPTRYIVS